MSGEGDMVLGLRAVLAPFLEEILGRFGRDWVVRYPATNAPQTPTANNPLGGANKTKSTISYEVKSITAAAFQNDITRDTTRIGSVGSSTEVPAYNMYVPYNQFNFSVPGFVIIDPDTKLEYTAVGDAQELGMLGLHVGWVLNLRAPNARGV